MQEAIQQRRREHAVVVEDFCPVLAQAGDQLAFEVARRAGTRKWRCKWFRGTRIFPGCRAKRACVCGQFAAATRANRADAGRLELGHRPHAAEAPGVG
jgi:hypothetical protein